MNFIRNIFSPEKSHLKYIIHNFYPLHYSDCPNDFKPNIDSIARLDSLIREIRVLFASQLEATPGQRRDIQKRIMTLNNRIKIFKTIMKRQDDTDTIQDHYKKMDIRDRYR